MTARTSSLIVIIMVVSAVATALRPEEKKKKASSIFVSPFRKLDSFQEKCDDEETVGDAAPTWSFLELSPLKPSFDRGTRACNWTVYYDDWAPTFDKGEYEHAWEGGRHCLEACCQDPNCQSLQLLSSENYQCYKYSKTPLMKKTGKLLGDAHWLLHKRKAWSVFVKGTPEQVASNIAKEYAKAPDVVNPFVNNSPLSQTDMLGWVARMGVIVVLAALVVRISAETTMKTLAKVKFSHSNGETSSLLAGHRGLKEACEAAAAAAAAAPAAAPAAPAEAQEECL